MTLAEFMTDTRFTKSQITNTIQCCIQSLLDVNYPGLQADRLSADMTIDFMNFLAENYTFKVYNTDNFNHVIAEPKN